MTQVYMYTLHAFGNGRQIEKLKLGYYTLTSYIILFAIFTLSYMYIVHTVHVQYTRDCWDLRHTLHCESRHR